MKSDAIILAAVEITVFWDFMPCGLEEVQFSRTCCLHHQGRKEYLPNQIKWYSFQDGSFAHQRADSEANMQDFLLYITLPHSNISMPSCILVQSIFVSQLDA